MQLPLLLDPTPPAAVAVRLDRLAAPESPIERASRLLTEVLQSGRPLVVGWSSGKDSSAVASLALAAAARLKREGRDVPPVVITHSDTTVENPIVVDIARREMQRMRVYAIRHGLSVEIRVGQPKFSERWAVRVIGGRALPPFPDTRRDCSTSWKIDVNRALMRQALKDLREVGEPVIVTGVRMGESQTRDRRIAARGETQDLWQGDGETRLSPILSWTVDDVWEYLGLCNAGIEDSYSNFAEVIEWYRDAGGGCVIVTAADEARTPGKPCGNRNGCWTCTAVTADRSMESLIATGGKYRRLKPLNDLRNFIANTQYDWSRRTMVGRTIDAEGNIAIGADVYSPAMLQELLRYTLTAQSLSGEQILSERDIVAIDARWSLYALARPFTAVQIYLEWLDGARWPIPKVERFVKSDVPRLGKLHVGGQWGRMDASNPTSGLSDLGWQVHHESACGPDVRVLPNGALVLDNESREPEPDAEGAALFFDLEAQQMVDTYSALGENCRWTDGYRYYLRLGILTVGVGQTRRIDSILRRSEWRQDHGLHGDVPLSALQARFCISTIV